MDRSLAPRSLQSLAAQWRVFGLLLVAFARRLVALDKSGVRGQAAEAERLSLWAGAALVQLNRQIALLSDVPKDAEAEHHFNHLKAMALALLALMMFAQKLRTDFVRRGKAAGHAMVSAACQHVLPFSQRDTGALIWARAVELLDPG